MVMSERQINCDRSKLIRLTSSVMFSTVLLFVQAGCDGNGAGGPMVSSLSTPTDATEGQTSELSADSVQAEPTAQEDSIASSPTAEPIDIPPALVLASAEEDLPDPPSEEDPMITMTSTATDVTARLTWDPSSDTNTAGYYVYYGKQPSGELGSCAYEQSQAVETPPATISGLEPNTPYYFAISAFNEAESPCSIEVMMVTPPVKG